jgi:hypothetical protein
MFVAGWAFAFSCGFLLRAAMDEHRKLGPGSSKGSATAQDMTAETTVVAHPPQNASESRDEVHTGVR